METQETVLVRLIIKQFRFVQWQWLQTQETLKKSHRKNDAIKLCAQLTAKLLTTSYKSKIIKFKLDEDSLQRQIYFLTFVDSLEMIFYQYKETCEILLDFLKIGGNNIKYFVKKAMSNILHAAIDVHNRRLLSSQDME